MVTASERTTIDVILSCFVTSGSISRTLVCHWSFLIDAAMKKEASMKIKSFLPSELSF